MRKTKDSTLSQLETSSASPIHRSPYTEGTGCMGHLYAPLLHSVCACGAVTNAMFHHQIVYASPRGYHALELSCTLRVFVDWGHNVSDELSSRMRRTLYLVHAQEHQIVAPEQLCQDTTSSQTSYSRPCAWLVYAVMLQTFMTRESFPHPSRSIRLQRMSSCSRMSPGGDYSSACCLHCMCIFDAADIHDASRTFL